MALALQYFNPHAATHRECDVTPDMMAGWKLPLGFPFFHDLETELPHEPTTRWLTSASLPTFEHNGHWHRSKALNRAYALQQFQDVLGDIGCDFGDASAPAFRLFADGLLGRVNEHTGDMLSSAYMSDLARYTAEAYDFTNAAGYTDVDLDAGPVLLALSDDDLDIPADGKGFGVRLRRQIRRKAMSETEWGDVARHLGPLRTDGWLRGMPSMRPRLGCEWGLQVGTRVRETSDIPADDVMGIRLEPYDVEGHVVLTLTRTKGMWIRDVIVPKRLVHASQYYYEKERAPAVAELRRRMGAAFAEPRSLLVNGHSAIGGIGRGASPASLQSDFRTAVMAAGLFDRVPLTLPRGEVVIVEIPRFTFHSLRHTFAIWMYHARKLCMGDSEPWIYIRARLGHRHLSTTLDTYLDLGRMLEPQIGRMLRDTFFAAVEWPVRG